MRILLFLIIGLVSYSCEPLYEHYYRIRIKNYSNENLYVYGKYILPDTLLENNRPELKLLLSGGYADITDNELNDIALEKFKTQKLSVFILSKDTVDKYEWSIIRENYLICKRYEINSQDLTEMGGTIIYP